MAKQQSPGRSTRPTLALKLSATFFMLHPPSSANGEAAGGFHALKNVFMQRTYSKCPGHCTLKTPHKTTSICHFKVSPLSRHQKVAFNHRLAPSAPTKTNKKIWCLSPGFASPSRTHHHLPDQPARPWWLRYAR